MTATHYLHTLSGELHESAPMVFTEDNRIELLDGSETHTFGLLSHINSALKLGNENGTYGAIEWAITSSPNTPL